MQNLQLAEVHPSIQHESCSCVEYGLILVRFNVAWYVLNSYINPVLCPHLLKDHLSFSSFSKLHMRSTLTLPRISLPCLIIATRTAKTSISPFVSLYCVMYIRTSLNHSLLADADDPVLAEALLRYHREGISSNAHIKQRLFAETGISARCVRYSAGTT